MRSYVNEYTYGQRTTYVKLTGAQKILYAYVVALIAELPSGYQMSMCMRSTHWEWQTWGFSLAMTVV